MTMREKNPFPFFFLLADDNMINLSGPPRACHQLHEDLALMFYYVFVYWTAY